MTNKYTKTAIVLVSSFFSFGTHAQVSAYSSANDYDVDVSYRSIDYTGNAMRILQQRHDNNLSNINHLVKTIDKVINKVRTRYNEENISFSERQVKYYNSYISYIDSVNRNVKFSDNNQANQVIRDLEGVKEEFDNWLLSSSQIKIAEKTPTTTSDKRLLISAIDLFEYKPVNKLKGLNDKQLKSLIYSEIDDDIWKQLIINAWSKCEKSNTNELYDMYTFYYGKITKSGFNLYCKEILILMQMDGVIEIN